MNGVDIIRPVRQAVNFKMRTLWVFITIWLMSVIQAAKCSEYLAKKVVEAHHFGDGIHSKSQCVNRPLVPGSKLNLSIEQ